jgi:hypothetical protein
LRAPRSQSESPHRWSKETRRGADKLYFDFFTGFLYSRSREMQIGIVIEPVVKQTDV